ncbi:MAG: TonB-dependent receptor [Ruminococcus sp.]|nr:TonB-dependent receptor [Ruminococcus sp.]
MFDLKNKIRKIGAGFMAGLCAFSMLGTNLSSGISAGAANTITTENSAFPNADEVIAKAATLLGSPYGWGFKGYTGVYYQGSYSPLSLDYVRNQGVDCSGLIYYTLTHLGYKTSGFSWNNPVPVDTMHWLTVSDNCTISYGGITSKIDVEKANLPTPSNNQAAKTYEYWECADGSTITPGSVVIADNLNGEDHSWIYMGEFDSRADVVNYLRNIGVSEDLITSKTVGDGKGDGGTHWRIESNGSQGCVINNRTDGKQSTAMNMYAFRITKTDVKFSITKVLSTDNSVKISGTSPIDNSKAVYGVYTDKACKNKVGEITIGADGTGSITLPDKQYYVKEISAPTGYDLSTDVVALKANSNVNVKENITSGIIKINKTAEDGVVGGREFKITWTDGGKQYSKSAKTNDKGIAVFDGLHVYDFRSKSAILYNIAEVNTEERYEIPKAQNVSLTDGNADLTVVVDFKNTLKKGSIKINKQSEDGQNGDRTFTISGGGQTYTLTTSNDGTAILADIPVFDGSNKPIVYTISENDVPVRYVVPAEQSTTLEADETVEVTFENKLKKFTAEVTKEDSENVSAQGNATLAGAVYGLYCDGERVASYTTDENGHFITDEFVCGNYTLQELSPSEGYQLNDEIYEVGAEPENYSIEVNSTSLDVTEDVKKGKISIIKHSDDDENIVENLESGAEFGIFLKSADSYNNAKDSEKDYLVTDENGFAESKLMPYGVYTVRQTKTVNDAAFVSNFDVFIAENGKSYEYILNNAPFKSYIHVTKIDAESGKTIPYEGAGFQIFDSKNQLVNMGVDTFYTNSEGFLITPETLLYGDYTLVEVQAPFGYILDKTPVPFSVTAANSEEENAVNIVKVIKSDTAQKGKISVQKTGEIFSSVSENDEKYTPVFEEKGLENAVFQVIAAEDIITPDGTVRAKTGDVLAELVTDENGYAESDLLYLGKYEVKEITAPYGYVKNPEIQAIELVYAGQEIAVRDTVNSCFNNDYQGVEISLEKVMEHDETFEIGTNSEYKNVRFGLFADEEIIAADGSAIPENGLIAEVTLDEDMKSVIAEKVPFGRYYVQEIATDEHYILNGEKYLVNFEYMGQEMAMVSVNCGQFVNELKRGTVKGIKVNESDEPLENALFGLFNTDCTEFTADNAIMTAKSDKQGKFEFSEVVYGEYIVREIAAPTGYILSTESYPVTISEDSEIIEISEKNKPITVEISKRDVHGNELVGAEMELINSYGETVEKWTSDGTNHVISGISAGKYVLKEIAAPNGYVIATDIEFEVFADGSVSLKNAETTAVSEDGNPLIVMVDEAEKKPEKTPEIPNIPVTSSVPTGDAGRNPIGLIMLIAGLGGLVIVSIIHRKRKNEFAEIERKYAELCPDFIERNEEND